MPQSYRHQHLTLLFRKAPNAIALRESSGWHGSTTFRRSGGMLPKCTTHLGQQSEILPGTLKKQWQLQYSIEPDPSCRPQLTYPLYMSLRSAIPSTIAAITVVFSNGQNRKGTRNAASEAATKTIPAARIMQSDGDLQHPTPSGMPPSHPRWQQAPLDPPLQKRWRRETECVAPSAPVWLEGGKYAWTSPVFVD